MPNDQAKKLFKGTLILTMAALFTKLLSAFYRIPFQNIVGDVGFYIYQQVYPFYGIAVALSTYGFPLIISKLYAEETAKEEQGNVRQLLFVSSLFLLCFGFLCFSVLYWGADWLASHMNDPQLALLLKIIAFVFLLMPVISLFRGFFQGNGNMIPTAISQIGEQLIRVITILIGAVLLMRHSYSLYIVGGGAVFGSITGGLVSVMILLFYWLRVRAKVPLDGAAIHKAKSREILKSLSIQGFTVCISSMLLIFIQLADSLNLYSLIVESGVGTEEAKTLKGIYDRGQPLIQLGTVVATSMSLSLVPIITKDKMQRNAVFLKGKIELALKISILVGVGATMGLWNIIKPANMMLFENTSGSSILALLSTLILLASVIMTVTAILQGLGYTVFPALVILGSFVVKYGLNMLLVSKYGTMGAALASVITLVFILVILMVKLRTIIGTTMINKQFFLVIGFAAIMMMVVLRFLLYGTDFIYDTGYSIRLLAGIQAMGAVFIGGITYMILILRGNLFKEEELSLLPFGSKLIIFLPKKYRR